MTEPKPAPWLAGDLRKDVELGRASVAPGVAIRGDNFFDNAQQIGGDHYQELSPQPFGILRSWNLPHAEGEAIYHIIRHRNKGGADDVRKAIQYLEMILAHDYTPAAGQTEEGKP